jgi:hypothetical protein
MKPDMPAPSTAQGVEASHTPGPWEVDGETIYGPDGYLIASVIPYYPENVEKQAANARRIVQCVNAHDELVAALRHIAGAAMDIGCERQVIAEAARAALATATGRN